MLCLLKCAIFFYNESMKMDKEMKEMKEIKKKGKKRKIRFTQSLISYQ